jgi:hypothetical protein
MSVIGLVRTVLLRSGKLLPVARFLSIAELTLEIRRHVARLEPAERRRVLELLRLARGRPGMLADDERAELVELVARTEPQGLVGTAVKRLSPVPVPRRMVEGGANAVGRALRARG